MSDLFVLSALTTSFLFAFFVWLFVHRSLVALKAPGYQRTSLLIAVVLFGWFTAVLWVSSTGLFSTNPAFLPNIVFGFLVLFELLRRFYFSKTMEKIVSAAPVVWLMGIQTYRIVGIGFFTLYGAGLLPAEFAYPAGIGDILVGVTAPLAAVLYYLKKSYARKIAIIWNIVGIADLVLALAIGFLAFPRPTQFLPILPTSVSTEVMSLFPMAIITLFAVPLALMVHLVCLRILKVDLVPSNNR